MSKEKQIEEMARTIGDCSEYDHLILVMSAEM